MSSTSISCITKPGKEQVKSAYREGKKVLACVSCQRRKKKCDRNNPCSNCVLLGINCTASQPAPHRKRRRKTQEMVERLERCEELLRQLAEGNKNGLMLAGDHSAERISSLDSAMMELRETLELREENIDNSSKEEVDKKLPEQTTAPSIDDLQLRPES
uniref:Zn(2)-C6 fungal-type domain-containing protein n=1 Tax=Bionectria ochroleuca TaxID=29856 RepID=A0A8H7N471_BIOOC